MFKKGDTTSGKRLASSAGAMYEDEAHSTLDMIDQVLYHASKVLKPDGMAARFWSMRTRRELGYPPKSSSLPEPDNATVIPASLTALEMT